MHKQVRSVKSGSVLYFECVKWNWIGFNLRAPSGQKSLHLQRIHLKEVKIHEPPEVWMFAEFNRQLVTSLLRTRLMWMHLMLALHYDCSKIVANQLFTLPKFIMVHCKICSSEMFRFGSLGKVASEVWGGVP